MIKVLHVIWDLGLGGAQSYLRDIVKYHRNTGKVEAKILALNTKGLVADEIEKHGIEIECAHLEKSTDIMAIPRLYWALRKWDYDIIHSHSHNWVFNSMLIKEKKPCIFTEHGGQILGGEWKNIFFYRLFSKNYTACIAISEEMAKVMRRISPSLSDRIVTIPNGINLDTIDSLESSVYSGIPEEITKAQYRVGIIGRLVPQKGIETFIDVAKELSLLKKDIAFPIVGDGPLRSELELQVKKYGIEKQVFFLGYRIDAKNILRSFDVFLFTSEYEPFGLVLIEAMASGVPVVALNLKGAVKEIIEDGVDGLIVNEKNIQLLAEAILSVLTRKNYRNKIINNARRKVEECFLIGINAERILDIYKHALKHYPRQ